MKEKIAKVVKREVILEDIKGKEIKLIFLDNDDYDTEEKITHNLLTSYEQRIKGICELESE